MEKTCTFKHVDFGSLKALVTVHFEEFEIRGFKVIESNGNPFIGMPSREVIKDGKKDYYDIVRFMDQDSKRDFSDWLLNAYQRELASGNSEGNRSVSAKRNGTSRNNGSSKE